MFFLLLQLFMRSFLLKYVEHWTGEGLSKTITQVYHMVTVGCYMCT